MTKNLSETILYLDII